MHLRQQILERVATLVTGLATTGARVTRSRVYTLDAATELPALVVELASGGTETASVETMTAPRVFQRTCRINVIGYAKADSNLDETLDQIALEVEKALAMPVSGPWKTLTYTSTDRNMTSDGEQPVGEITLSYDAMYLARENSPDSATL